MPRQVELRVTTNPPSTNCQWFIVGEDEVTGTVIVETDELLECNYISITLEGVGWMSWGKEGCRDSGTAREEYIKVTIDLWRKEAAHGQASLPPGQHELPFRFSLPMYLPPTLDLSPRGVIEYVLIARIAKSGFFRHLLQPDKTARSVIDVKRKGTHLPGDTTVYHRRFQTDIGCGSCNCCGGLCACCYDCCKTGCFTFCSRTCCRCSTSGPVSLAAEIPRTYFCVGETIPIKATVENEGNKAIRVQAKLVQEVRFTSRISSTYKKQLDKVESNRMQPHTTTVWEPVIIVPTRIDATLPLNVGKVVSIIYYLVVEVSEPWGATACFRSKVMVALDSQLSAPPPQVDAPVQMPGPQQLPRPLQVGAPYQAPDPQQAPQLLAAYPLWSEATAPPQPVFPYQPIQPAAAGPQLTTPVLKQPVGPSAPQLEPGFADLPPSYAEVMKTEK